MRIAADNIAQMDRALAGFLVSMAGSRPDCRSLLLVDGEILNELTANPSPLLTAAWEKLAQAQFPGRPQNRVVRSPRLQITPALTGLAVVVHNRIFRHGEESSSALREAAELHDQALLKLLPLPETVIEILSFDLLITAGCRFMRKSDADIGSDKLHSALLRLSPFSALQALDLELPRPLARRAPEYLPHWQPAAGTADFKSENDLWWSRVEDILARPELAAALIQAWLEMPENRLSCVGLGIFFEEIRQRGDYDNLILNFFEAYEFIHKVLKPEADSGDERSGPALLHLIETLLAAAGDDSSSRRLNQIGNEYFLKFRALLEIVAARGGIPGGFRHLSHDFCFKQLLPLTALATITGGRRQEAGSQVDFGQVSFS